MSETPNKPLIITAGEKYNDIDALACAVALDKIYNLKGVSSKVIFPGPLNESVTKVVRGWGYYLETTLIGHPEDYKYILVDISEPSHFAKFVVLENVVEIYDHRHGFEDLWKHKIGEKAKIEMVGACATLIWEEYIKAGLSELIDPTSANLLYTAILSNTLNLQAKVTTQRDVNAVKDLANRINLPSDWRQTYFSDVSQGIMSDPLGSMTNDTKILEINGSQYTITQLELWNSDEFVKSNYDLIVKVLTDSKTPYTFLTSPSISQGFNYLVAINPNLKDKLSSCLDVTWQGNVGKTKKLWLRKEIMRLL